VICPDAGEPKGVGAFDLPLSFGGQTIQPGDWLVGDLSGLVVIPAKKVVEVANRAQDVMEREQRFAAEVEGGRTLADLAELAKWEASR
jgi:3-hexulose-6-phosphate synthase/6-phospho-3-hexuloisomerase